VYNGSNIAELMVLEYNPARLRVETGFGDHDRHTQDLRGIGPLGRSLRLRAERTRGTQRCRSARLIRPTSAAS
jgi:hypothetical protein